MMKYKGYTGAIVALDEAQDLLHGELQGIRDVVTFQGRNVEELQAAFRDSVDDYVQWCKSEGGQPEKPPAVP